MDVREGTEINTSGYGVNASNIWTMVLSVTSTTVTVTGNGSGGYTPNTGVLTRVNRR